MKPINACVVIDDDPTTSRLKKNVLVQLLEEKNISAFANGKDALDHIAKNLSANTDSKTLLLMNVDLHISGSCKFMKDFFPLYEKIKCRIKIVVVSSTFAMREIEFISVNSYVTKGNAKPFDINSLKEILGDVGLQEPEAPSAKRKPENLFSVFLKKIEKSKKSLSLKLRLLFFLAFLLLNHTFLICQQTGSGDYRLGINAESFLSGDGHGTFFSGNLVLANDKNVWGIGPCLQKRSMKMRCVDFYYEHELADNNGEENNSAFKDCRNGTIQLDCFSELQYANKLPLSFNMARLEQTANQVEGKNWNQITLSTIELSAGVGLNVKLAKHLQWKNFIGICVYYHTNYIPGMCEDRIAPVLTIGSGLNLF